MNTESKPVDGELFDATDTAELQPVAESTTDQKKGEEIENTAKEESEAQDIAELNRQKQISTFRKRVESGEITLDEVPHAWIRKELEAKIKPKEDISETVRKAIQAEKEAERYSEQRARLNELGLSEEKRQRVTEEFKDLVDSGLSKAKALDKAIKIAGIRLEEPSRFAARIPKPSSRKVETDDGIRAKLEEGEYPSDVPEDKRFAFFEKMRKAK